MSTTNHDDREPTLEQIEQLGRAWIRNGSRLRNQQLVSCGRILLGRLGIEAPMTNDERAMIERVFDRLT